MKTLHMYRWRNTQTIQANKRLIGPKDTLLIYGPLNDDDLDRIQLELAQLNNPCYVVKNEKGPHIDEYLVNENKWLELILEHNNTLTWK
ncbi:hypothetical protein OS175_13860 [Marinicella sp. S1101]|uniref:hypothetical protein n=1 Tax=Marinicella marina TaxID=2996016 RepID=UPI002260DB1E|nr:hypothetical protein [Marinicella marina]MCX7554958.1 hypothetical protein [Marinicella marina]MDJ1141568.1 hypothetical protein [Marinicella marina]